MRMRVTLNLNAPETLLIRLTPGWNHCISRSSYPPPSLKFLYKTSGADGVVYSTSSGYIIKVATADQNHVIEHEAAIYEYLFHMHLLDLVPRYYGLFKNKSRAAIILSNEGSSLDNFQSLSESDR
jgi:hypothetical protein